jgi:hypothetical protein
VLGLKGHQVIENFFLPFGESHVRASTFEGFSTGTLGEKKAHVKSNICSVCSAVGHPVAICRGTKCKSSGE